MRSACASPAAQRGSVGQRQRRHRHGLLGFDAKRLAAAREQADLRAFGQDAVEQVCYPFDQMLAVVDDQQRLAARQCRNQPFID